MLIGRGGGGKPQPESGCPSASYKPPTTVTGADSSPSLIDICKSRFPMQHWNVADMRGLHLNKQFDGVIAWDSFFHLCPEDQRRMIPLFREHSAPNAALLFTSGTSHGEAIGEYRGEPLYHGSLDTKEYRELLHDYGFEIVSHVERDVACGLRTIWLAHLRKVVSARAPLLSMDPNQA
jgi:hypothetical protein